LKPTQPSSRFPGCTFGLLANTSPGYPRDATSYCQSVPPAGPVRSVFVAGDQCRVESSIQSLPGCPKLDVGTAELNHVHVDCYHVIVASRLLHVSRSVAIPAACDWSMSKRRRLRYPAFVFFRVLERFLLFPELCGTKEQIGLPLKHNLSGTIAPEWSNGTHEVANCPLPRFIA
jgi:hypothetical protein